MVAVIPESCRVTLQWNKSDCILLHLVGLLFNINMCCRDTYSYRNTEVNAYMFMYDIIMRYMFPFISCLSSRLFRVIINLIILVVTTIIGIVIILRLSYLHTCDYMISSVWNIDKLVTYLMPPVCFFCIDSMACGSFDVKPVFLESLFAELC